MQISKVCHIRLACIHSKPCLILISCSDYLRFRKSPFLSTFSHLDRRTFIVEIRSDSTFVTFSDNLDQFTSAGLRKPSASWFLHKFCLIFIYFLNLYVTNSCKRIFTVINGSCSSYTRSRSSSLTLIEVLLFILLLLLFILLLLHLFWIDQIFALPGHWWASGVCFWWQWAHTEVLQMVECLV